jgi:hypothetical protein
MRAFQWTAAVAAAAALGAGPVAAQANLQTVKDHPQNKP